MGQNNSIQDFTSLDITYLFQRNEGGKEWFESIGYYFGNNFLENITEGNGFELIRGGDIGFLRDESEEGSIKGWESILVTG